MKKSRSFKQAVAMLLSLVMITQAMPIIVSADEESGFPQSPIGEIISFAPLPNYVAEQVVPLGTGLSELALPNELFVTLAQPPSTPTDLAVTDVFIPITWESNPWYDGHRPGEYIFTAAAAEGFVFAVYPPVIRVTVTAGAGDMPEIRAAAPAADFFSFVSPFADDTAHFTITADSGNATIPIVRVQEPDSDPGIITEPGQITLTAGTRNIQRDFDQTVFVTVQNTTPHAVKYYLVSDNRFGDIFMNFVESGSIDEPLVILSGETHQVELTVFAQNTTRAQYYIPVTLYLVENGISTPDTVATLIINVPRTPFDLSITEIDFDPNTLARTFRITNVSTTWAIPDLTLSLEGPVAEFASISPGVFNYRLLSGSRNALEVQIIPDLAGFKQAGITRTYGRLVAQGSGSQSIDISFDTEGREISLITMGQLGLRQDGNPFYNLSVVEDSFESIKEEVRSDGFDIQASYDLTFGDGDIIAVEISMVGKEYTGNPDSFNEIFELIEHGDGTASAHIRILVDRAIFEDYLPVGFAPANFITPHGGREYVGRFFIDIYTRFASNNYDLFIGSFFEYAGRAMSVVGGVDIARRYAVFSRDESANPNTADWSRLIFDTAVLVGPLVLLVGAAPKAAMALGIIGAIGGLIGGLLHNHRDNQAAMTQELAGSQCTNVGHIQMHFLMPNIGTPTAAWSSSRIYNYRHRAGRFVNHEITTLITPIINGHRLDAIEEDLNRISFIEIPIEFLRPRLNIFRRFFSTNPGRYFVDTDKEITFIYPPCTEIAFIGEADTLPDVRSRPDLAVFWENVFVDCHLIAGEESPMEIFFSNRGSARTWTEIKVFINGSLVYTDSDYIGDGRRYYRYVEAFTEDSITINWTPQLGENTIEVVLRNKGEGIGERRYDNNHVIRTVTAREREVPVITYIAPHEVFLNYENPIWVTADFRNPADLVSVTFAVDGGAPVEAFLARRDSAGRAGIRASALLPLELGANEVTVRAVYRTGRETTNHVERTETVTARAAGQVTFSVDSTVADPTFRLFGGTLNISPGTEHGTFVLQKTAAMAISPQRSHLITISEAGIIVTNLSDLDGAVLSLNNARELTFITGEAVLNSVNIANVRVGGINTTFTLNHSFPSPDVILFSDNITNVQTDANFSVEGVSGTMWYNVSVEPNGVLDLNRSHRVFRFVLPQNHGSIANIQSMLDIFTRQYWGNQAVTSGIQSRFNYATRTLTVVVTGITSVRTIYNAEAIFARLPINNTLFEVDITNHTAPVVLNAAGYSAINFEIDTTGNLDVISVGVFPRIQGRHQTHHLWGDVILLPPERYGLHISYTVDGVSFTHFADDVDAASDTVITLPSEQADYSTTVTFAWPHMFEHAHLMYNLGGNLWSPWQNVARSEPVRVSPGNIPIQFNLSSQLQNPAGSISAAISGIVNANEGENTAVTFGSTFSAEAFRTAIAPVNGGSTIALGIRDIFDDADSNNELTSFWASHPAHHMVGIVTFTNAADDTEVYVVPVSGTIGQISRGMNNLQVRAPNADGNFYFTITLTTDRDILPDLPVFPFTITAGVGGVITMGVVGDYEEGAQIPIGAQANVGFTFSGWTSTDGGSFADASSPATTFTMPANAASVTANFTEDGAAAIPVVGVSITGEAARDMVMGQSLALTASIAPSNATNQAVTWTSSNRAVAAVSATGTVTAALAGTTEITAVTEDGGFSATVTINVTQQQQQQTFTVSFNLNGGIRTGGGELVQTVPQGGAAVAPVAVRDGFTFNGWDRPFVNVNGNITVNAMWTRNDPGDPGDPGDTWEPPYEPTPTPRPPTITPTPAPTPTPTPTPTPPAAAATPENDDVSVNYTIQPDGNVVLNLPDNVIAGIANAARESGVAEFDLIGIADARSATFAVTTLERFHRAGLDVSVALPTGTITFGQTALANLVGAASQGNITITVRPAVISDSASDTSNRRAFELLVHNGRNYVTNFGGNVEVSLPYRLGENEISDALVVYRADENGELSVIKNIRYDYDTGRIFFTTAQFSVFVIRYSPVIFNDTANHWARSPITQSAARGLVSGYPDGTFSPDGHITRAEFIQLMYNALGLNEAANAQSVYPDVSPYDWFFTAVMSAGQAGLLNGIAVPGSDFRPNDPISRLEMADVLSKIAAGRRVSAVNDFRIQEFLDYADISPLTASGVESAIRVGFLNADGMGNGRFEPNSYTTRAQAATIQITVIRALGRLN